MGKHNKRCGQALTHRAAGGTPARITRTTGPVPALLAVSMALFGCAGAAGSYVAFSQSDVPFAAVATLEPEARPVAAPTTLIDTIPARAPAQADTPATGAQVAAVAPASSPDLSSPVAQDCVATLDALAASIFVPFEPYAIEAARTDLGPVVDLARRVAECDSAYIVVVGHAAPSGDETRNLVLSWQRAAFVITHLSDAGFDTTLFEAIGFGSRRPASETGTGLDDTINRRVDFIVRTALP